MSANTESGTPAEPVVAEVVVPEWKQEMEKAWNVGTGDQEDCVRIYYRFPPTRAWTKFLFFSDWTYVGVPPDIALNVIAQHSGRPTSTTPPDGGS